MSPKEDVPREETSDAERAERIASPPQPAAAENLTGQRLAGRFELQALIGGGPIGQVYRALRCADGATVAVKILHEKHRPDPNVVRRFAREAQAAMQLDHPHIARVYEHGVDEAGRPFLCSEWVEGVPLTQAVAAKPLTLKRILVPLCQALSALSEAQRHGVLHRGLKPSNLLTVERGEGEELALKVCDFGMAKLLKPVPGTLSTKYGAPCGAVEYAAPEQAERVELDGRTDVYAIGVVLYELLTGQVPFRGGSDAAVLAKHRHDAPVPPQKLRHDRSIPREVESICLKALAKQPAERYRSPRELRNALHSTLELLGVRADLPIEEPPKPDAVHETSRLTMPGEQLRSRQKIWVGAGLLLLVCGVVWLSAPGDGEEPRDAPISVGGMAPGAQVSEENAALREGKRRLADEDAAGAVEQLQLARQQLGETPQVRRWLGEALLRAGQRAEGQALLRRYLALDPHAGDRTRVEALLASP